MIICAASSCLGLGGVTGCRVARNRKTKESSRRRTRMVTPYYCSLKSHNDTSYFVTADGLGSQWFTTATTAASTVATAGCAAMSGPTNGVSSAATATRIGRIVAKYFIVLLIAGGPAHY